MSKHTKIVPGEAGDGDDAGAARTRRQRVVVLKPRHYRRSTPLGRLRSNVQKVARHAGFVSRRVASWEDGGPEVRAVAEGAQSVTKIAGAMDATLEQLERAGWEPSPRPSTVEYAPGDHVAVAEKYVDKYSEALAGLLKSDPDVLGDLVVDKVLPTGELVLRRGRRVVVPMAPRSHLVPREDEDDEE